MDREKEKEKGIKANMPIIKRKTSIGGQALIEGVMMRGPDKIAIAVRKPDSEIEIKTEKIKKSSSKISNILSLPVIRGSVGLVDAIKIGTSAIMYSAKFYEERPKDKEGNPKKTIFEKLFKKNAEKAENTFVLITSLSITIGLFMILPNVITSFFKNWVESPVFLNLIEGAFRITVFLGYIIAVSKLEDVKRVFQYHGAEHKSIHCYESGLSLTINNVKKFSILHPRCGTSFLFTVMMVSILVLSFFGWPNPILRIVTRILMFPIIAGISYEINRVIGRSDSKFSYALSYPGLMIQKFATVKEPDDRQIEVAIESLLAVIPEDKEADLW